MFMIQNRHELYVFIHDIGQQLCYANSNVVKIQQDISKLADYLSELPTQVLNDKTNYCIGVEIDADNIVKYKFSTNGLELLQQKLQYLSELLQDHCSGKRCGNDIQMTCLDILQLMLPM